MNSLKFKLDDAYIRKVFVETGESLHWLQDQPIDPKQLSAELRAIIFDFGGDLTRVSSQLVSAKPMPESYANLHKETPRFSTTDPAEVLKEYQRRSSSMDDFRSQEALVLQALQEMSPERFSKASLPKWEIENNELAELVDAEVGRREAEARILDARRAEMAAEEARLREEEKVKQEHQRGELLEWVNQHASLGTQLLLANGYDWVTPAIEEMFQHKLQVPVTPYAAGEYLPWDMPTVATLEFESEVRQKFPDSGTRIYQDESGNPYLNIHGRIAGVTYDLVVEI